MAAAPKKDGGDDLLDIFDNFYAMPYGPVESDVYNAMCEDKLPSFSVKYRSIEPREGAEPYNAKRYNCKLYHRVRNAVNDLREKNEKLVLLNAFELVEITHRWSSWDRAMDFAEFMGQMSAKMSIDSIRDSSKIFDLKCDAICLCPGWEKSKGCQLEHFVAQLWDKEIIEFERLKYSKIWKEK